MFFSKIELHQDSEAIARLALQVCQDGYRLHQAVWDLFSDGSGGQRRDFLYRRVEQQDWPCFYAVSARPPVDKVGIWRCDQVKTYTPRLSNGQRLAFSLCANPVVTRHNENGKPVRHDVVMDAKKRLEDRSRIALAELIQKAGQDWLQARADRYGFRLEQVRVDGYRQHRLWKGKGSLPIRFSTLEFNGLLTVADTDRLVQVLYQGIGPAKGFGCGLLLVRRV
jgi:CRISPR system Cascade subunit CasE